MYIDKHYMDDKIDQGLSHFLNVIYYILGSSPNQLSPIEGGHRTASNTVTTQQENHQLVAERRGIT